MNNLVNAAKKFTAHVPVIGKTLYIGAVSIGFIQGSVQGWVQHDNWRHNRRKVSVNSITYDPIINLSRDLLYWGGHVVNGGLTVAFIVGTAPISIPILLYFSH
jgi:hypothetical protein